MSVLIRRIAATTPHRRRMVALAAALGLGLSALVAVPASAVAVVSDVGVTMTAPASTQVEEVIDFVSTLHNYGPDPATGVQMNQSQTGQATFVSLTAPAGWTCDSRAVGALVGIVNCTLSGALAVGADAVITLRVKVDRNAVQVDDFSSQINPGETSGTTLNNTAQKHVDVIAPQADQSIQVTGPTAAPRGSVATYTIVVRNLGPVSAQFSHFVVALPTEATFVSFSGPAAWVCSLPAVGSHGQPACNFGAPPDFYDLFANGGVGTFTLRVLVDPAATGPMTTTGYVYIGNPPDPNSANNIAHADTVVGVAPPTRVATKVTGWPAKPLSARKGSGAVKSVTVAVTVTPAKGRAGVVQYRACRIVKKKKVCTWKTLTVLTWPTTASGTRTMKLKSRKGVSTTYRLVFAITAAGTAYTTAPVKVTGR